MSPGDLPVNAGTPASPAPVFGLTTLPQVLFFFIALFVAGALLVFFLKHLLAWMDRRGWVTYTGHVPTYGSLGRAFMELQSLTQPGYEYVMEAEDEETEKKEEDDEGGPDKSGRSRLADSG